MYSCAKQNGRQFVAGEPVALPATFSVQNENENEGMVSNMTHHRTACANTQKPLMACCPSFQPRCIMNKTQVYVFPSLDILWWFGHCATGAADHRPILRSVCHISHGWWLTPLLFNRINGRRRSKPKIKPRPRSEASWTLTANCTRMPRRY